MSLRDAIQVSDSVLSKQLSILEKAGFVKIKKSFAGKMPRTSASSKRDGCRAGRVGSALADAAGDCGRLTHRVDVTVQKIRRRIARGCVASPSRPTSTGPRWAADARTDAVPRIPGPRQ